MTQTYDYLKSEQVQSALSEVLSYSSLTSAISQLDSIKMAALEKQNALEPSQVHIVSLIQEVFYKCVEHELNQK